MKLSDKVNAITLKLNNLLIEKQMNLLKQYRQKLRKREQFIVHLMEKHNYSKYEIAITILNLDNEIDTH